MNISSILPLLAAIAYIPLVIITATNRPWQKHHWLIILYLLSGITWSTFSFLVRSEFLLVYKVILFRLTMISFIWFVIQYYFFVRYFTYRKIDWVTYFGYFMLGILLLGAILNYWPVSLQFINGKVIPELGFWIVPIVIIPIFMAAYLLYILIKKFNSSNDPIERNRLTYLFITVILITLFGVINSTRLGDIFPTAQIGHLLNAALLTYATLRYRILDMNQVVKRVFTYSILLIASIATLVGWISIFSYIFRVNLTFYSVIGIGLLTGISILSYWSRLENLIIKRVDQWFYGETFDYRKNLSDFIKHKISSIFSLDELIKGLLPILLQVLECKNIYILLPDSTNKDYVAKYIEPMKLLDTPFIIKSESPIVHWLKRENKYLHIHSIEYQPEFKSLWKNEKDKLRDLEIELLFPLISRENLVGIIACSRKTVGKYTLDQTNLVEDACGQIAISIEKEFIQAELRRSEQELALINRLSGVMTSSLNINEVYDAFINGLREVVDIDFAAVVLLEENELLFSAIYSDVSSPWTVGQKIPLKGSGTEWVIRYKKSLYEPDLSQDRMFYTGEEYLKRGIRSVLYLPLITKGEGIGSLIIATRHTNAYSANQIQLLERLASQISTSVANAQLFAHAEQRARVDELTGLFNRRHFDESLKLEVNRHSRYGSQLSIAFLDLDNFKSYNDTMGHPQGDKLLTHVGRIIRGSIRSIDLAFRYGGDEFSIIMPHTSAEDAFGVAERIRVRISDQLRYSNNVITTSIGIASWPSDGLTPDDLVNAADKALYYTKQTGGNRTCLVSQMLPSLQTDDNHTLPAVERETLNTIYALAATIEARDPYTYGHSRKVRAYAVALAESLGLPSDKVAVIGHAALLHDIGKIGVIDQILKKKGKLEPEEYNSIKSHPQLSKTIVEHISMLAPCIPAILHHHERYDGTGYPAGLKGEAIPLEARILAIADAFDAMTSLRPYRAPLSFKEAINELKRCSGSQFDPALVEKFIPICLTISIDERDMKIRLLYENLDID